MILVQNAWELPLDLGGLFDAQGRLSVSKQQVVDQLNQFFVLKADHEMGSAKQKFADGLQLALDAHDLLSEVTQDGIIESAAGADAGYAEVRSLLATLQRSMTQTEEFPFVTPALHLNLLSFFDTPPDASAIDIDPFVLEKKYSWSTEETIMPVEAFFSQAIQNTLDIDFNQAYVSGFRALHHDFVDVVFDEFDWFFMGGEKLGL